MPCGKPAHWQHVCWSQGDPCRRSSMKNKIGKWEDKEGESYGHAHTEQLNVMLSKPALQKPSKRSRPQASGVSVPVLGGALYETSNNNSSAFLFCGLLFSSRTVRSGFCCLWVHGIYKAVPSPLRICTSQHPIHVHTGSTGLLRAGPFVFHS